MHASRNAGAKEAQMRGEWGPMLTRTVDLGYDQLLVLEARPGMRVRVLYGNMWLTEEGFAQDVFAGSGDEVALKSRGLAVVEGLGLARVQVIEPQRGRLWRRVQAAAQALAVRLRSAGSVAARLLHA
jgi:Protein of unknown function (DUF2917)